MSQVSFKKSVKCAVSSIYFLPYYFGFSAQHILVDSATMFCVNALKALLLLKLHKISGGLTLATSRYMVTFYLKMLVFICRGGEVDVNLLRKEWGYFLLECTLNDSFSPSFVSDISAVFSVKLNPVRQTLSRGRTEDSCERFTYISSLCCFQAFTCYSFGRFFFSFFFFPS